MVDLKISQTTATTAPTGDDLVPLVDDPAGTPTTKHSTLTNLAGSAPFSGLYAPLPGSVNGPPKVVYKTADESVTSSAVVQNDDHLVLPVGANEIWIGRVILNADGVQAGDIAMNFSVPASATGWWAILGPSRSVTSVEGDLMSQTRDFGSGDGSAGLVGTGAGNHSVILIEFYLDTAGTAGNLQFQWAQRVSSGTATTVYAGSRIEGQRIA